MRKKKLLITEQQKAEILHSLKSGDANPFEFFSKIDSFVIENKSADRLYKDLASLIKKTLTLSSDEHLPDNHLKGTLTMSASLLITEVMIHVGIIDDSDVKIKTFRTSEEQKKNLA